MDRILLFLCMAAATVAGIAGISALSSSPRAAGLYLAGALLLLMLGAFSGRRVWAARRHSADAEAGA